MLSPVQRWGSQVKMRSHATLAWNKLANQPYTVAELETPGPIVLNQIGRFAPNLRTNSSLMKCHFLSLHFFYSMQLVWEGQPLPYNVAEKDVHWILLFSSFPMIGSSRVRPKDGTDYIVSLRIKQKIPVQWRIHPSLDLDSFTYCGLVTLCGVVNMDPTLEYNIFVPDSIKSLPAPKLTFLILESYRDAKQAGRNHEQVYGLYYISKSPCVCLGSVTKTNHTMENIPISAKS